MLRILNRMCGRVARPPQPDPSRIEGLEALAGVSRRDDADQLGQLIAEAECARLGHVHPPQPDTGSVDFVPWGLADPFPRCQRCKVRLGDDAEGAASDA